MTNRRSGTAIRPHRAHRPSPAEDSRHRLVSVAGLRGARVCNQSGAEIGRVVDVVVRWRGEEHPPVTGLVVRIGRRRTWMPVANVGEVTGRSVVLRSARLDLREFERRPGEVQLGRDVIDHQMVDVDEVRVFRAADLYLARVAGTWVLLGADVGLGTLLRRLGPARFRGRATPERVIDWAAIQPFGDVGGPVRLLAPHGDLARLRPGELADLLEDLGRREREELLDAVDGRLAADALEEMDADGLRNLLRELPAHRTAALVAGMEPDEAAEALRDLDAPTREALLDAMPDSVSTPLRNLLGYSDRSAGGLMTTSLLTARPDQTVAEVRARLREVDDPGEVDAVAVVDADGALVDDLPLVAVLLAAEDTPLAQLASVTDAVAVEVSDSLEHVIDALISARRRSIVVTDDVGAPIGRILADDVVDALVPDRGRVRFPRLLT